MSINTNSSYVLIGRKEKIAYGFGDFASNLSFGFVSLFLLFFYTNVYGIGAAQASFIFFIARIVDAIFNLGIGYAIDRTKTRYGKLRPWLLCCSVPLGILSSICFIGTGESTRFWYALISYTLYCLAYTAVNTPYSAMTNMMTQHEGSRASLSMYRLLFATLGYFVVSTFADYFISQFSDAKQGYLFTASGFALVATVMLLLCFKMTRERVDISSAPPSLKEMISAVSTNKPLIQLSIFTGFFYIAYTVWMAIAIYYIKYFIQQHDFTQTFFLIQSLAYIAGTLISGKLISRLGNKKTTLLALAVGIIGCCGQYFLSGDNIILIMTCVCLFSFTLGVGFVTMWAMIADTVEYAEWRNGIRAEGAIYGFFNFITKIAMAIGGGCAGLLLDYFDYQSDAINSSALNGINVMMTLFPAGLFLIGGFFIYIYTFDEKAYRDVISELNNKIA